MMKIILAALVAALALSTSYVLSAPAFTFDNQRTPTPYPGIQPVCTHSGCHSPSGVHGLKRNGRKYHRLCDKNAPLSKNHHHQPVACFNTQLQLQNNLSAPSPKKLHGVIDGSGTNLALFAGQSVTLADTLEIHVEKVKHDKKFKKHCIKVKVYHLPERSVQVYETWCAHQDQPVQL